MVHQWDLTRLFIVFILRKDQRGINWKNYLGTKWKIHEINEKPLMTILWFLLSYDEVDTMLQHSFRQSLVWW